uniref:FPL domain-containing protein n=1 Tax=Meloidogyne floridensis TaxID=298350 RepID=A0A915PBD4_9BILA
MLKKFSNPTLWRSKNPHSLEYLRYLQGVLVKNEKITEGNRALVIEAMRAITEILIWGDQNDAAVFDFFLERQMFSHFLQIMQQADTSFVNIQLLQTLNILFENTKNETSLYFLLSNNHVNSIISHNFDFSNEEIIAYYISFLKTLSFKLNTKTNADQFPLFTEAVRFHKHSEPMVKEQMLHKFVITHSRDYFNNVCQEIAHQIIEMDTFARSAQNEASNRSRLSQYIDNLLVIDCLHQFLIGPIYLASLASIRAQPNTLLISRVTCLFLFAQFLKIIQETETVQNVLTSLFFGDINDIKTEWVRTLSDGISLAMLRKWDKSVESSPFRNHLFMALHDGNDDDHACFFALIFINYILQNQAAQKELLNAAQLPFPGSTNKCDSELADCLIRIIENCSLTDTLIRPITVELCTIVLRHILLCLESDQEFYSLVESSVRKTLHKLSNVLRGALQTEKFFLEMFEEEYYQLQKSERKINTFLDDPGLYLPPSNTPLSGLPLFKRISSGNDERIRRSLQFYFIIRKFAQDLSGETESFLPISSQSEPMAELNDCINLNNSDLLACTVVNSKNERLSQFLVTDQFQFILVEPDSRKLGWGIVRFVALLQDVLIVGTSDNRTLQINVEDVETRVKKSGKNIFSAHLIFDDYIRCMAAKQRLNRG